MAWLRRHTTPLLSGFPSIVVFTQQLAILFFCFAAFMPGFYVVGFHSSKIEVVFAFYANALLTLINFPLRFHIKLAEVQSSLRTLGPIPDLSVGSHAFKRAHRAACRPDWHLLIDLFCVADVWQPHRIVPFPTGQW